MIAFSKNQMIIFLFLWSMWTMSSCSLNDDLNIEIPDQQKQFVVEGYITPGYPMEITLIENNLMNDELTLLPVWNAKVSITVNGRIYDLDNIYYRKKDRQVFVNYRSNDTLIYQTGTPIQLNILTKDNKILYSETTTLNNIAINKCERKDDKIEFSWVDSTPRNRFFRVSLSGFSKGSVISSKTYYFDFSTNNSNTTELSIPNELLKTDSLELALFNIHEDYFNYMQSANNATSAYYDPFLTPEPIKSNIEGGIGIFTFYTVDRRVIR